MSYVLTWVGVCSHGSFCEDGDLYGSSHTRQPLQETIDAQKNRCKDWMESVTKVMAKVDPLLKK